MLPPILQVIKNIYWFKNNSLPVSKIITNRDFKMSNMYTLF